MAFITPVSIPTVRVNRESWKAKTTKQTVMRRHVRICACERSPSGPTEGLKTAHPYGNGNIDMTLDWTGWDPKELARQVAEAEAGLKNEQLDKMKVSCWKIAMNPEMILHGNRVWEESVKAGFSADISGLKLLPMMEPVAEIEIEASYENLWVVTADEKDVQVTTSNGKSVLLCFSREEEARIYANELRDSLESDSKVDLVQRVPKDIRAEYEPQGSLLGLVPAHSVVTPSLVKKYL